MEVKILGSDPRRPLDLLLVNSPLKDYGREPRLNDFTLPVIGLGYIATVARAEGHNVGVLDAESQGLGVREVADAINRLSPRWAGLNLLAPTYKLAREIVRRLKVDIQILLGGHQAKAMPDSILSDPSWPRIDALVLGEAEHKVTKLLQNPFAREKMAGVGWRVGPSMPSLNPAVSNDPLVPRILDDLPFVNREFFFQDPYRSPEGRIEANLVASRGCPYDCTFCGAAISANRDVGIRTRTPGNIVDEMEQLRTKYSCNAFRFVDDLFLANISFIKGCLKHFIDRKVNESAVWDATGRINVLSQAGDDVYQLIAQSGCREVALGIESGSNRVLELMDKRITSEMSERVISRLIDHGICVKGYFIFGYPSESRAELSASMDLIKRLWRLGDGRGSRFRCSAFEFRPYPGTPVWNQLIDSGKYSAEELLDYQHVDLTEGGTSAALADRDEFNFTVNKQFGEATLDEIRSAIRSIMLEQKKRIASAA